MTPSALSSPSRRAWLQSAACVGALGGIRGASAAETSRKMPVFTLEPGSVIVFQGDSITDAGRDKKVLEPNDGKALGKGYAAMAAGEILVAHPELKLSCFNRGISGNKIPDLAGRWEEDVIKLKPTVLSILIGVNDLWHTFAFGNKYKATVADYETGYRALIDRSLEQIPGVKIVICEPFTTRTTDDFKALADYRAVAKKLADEKKLCFVPFQSLFDDAVEAAPAEFWLWDGIHPSMAGYAIMVREWRDVVGI